MKAVASKRPAAKGKSARAIAEAREAPYPGFVEFCDPTLRETAPAGREWLHEIKIDGYRAQVHIHAGQVTVYSRSGYDWTRQFAAIARAADQPPDALREPRQCRLANRGAHAGTCAGG
jgi:bifunctional non-homologous end joining protein LigD